MEGHPGCSLLFTSSEQDALVKASVLRSSLSNARAGVHREEEQCFLGHAFAPFRLIVTPKSLVGVSSTEVICWSFTGSNSAFFEEVFFNTHLRQDGLPAEQQELTATAELRGRAGAALGNGSEAVVGDVVPMDKKANAPAFHMPAGTMKRSQASPEQSMLPAPAVSDTTNLLVEDDHGTSRTNSFLRMQESKGEGTRATGSRSNRGGAAAGGFMFYPGAASKDQTDPQLLESQILCNTLEQASEMVEPGQKQSYSS
ncbi:unnamed protein product, partial [Amoebophrya sp. A25]|eukprot:GSA25T00015142001.1